MFYIAYVVEPLRYDSVLIKETNEWMNEDHLQKMRNWTRYWRRLSDGDYKCMKKKH